MVQPHRGDHRTVGNPKAAAVKTCQRCKQDKPLGDFYPDRTKKLKVSTYCKKCSVILSKEAYLKRSAKPKIIPDQKTCSTCLQEKPSTDFWGLKASSDGLQPECKECRKARVRRHRYGISPEDFKELMLAQDGRCACCDQKTALHVDHCHSTGRVRGLLCSNCNTAIGLLGDDCDRLMSAVAYLQNE